MYKVIVADDNPIVCRALESRIPWSELGLSLAGLCKDGEEVLAKAAEDPPDILITDIMMPVLDGLAAIHRLKALGSPIQCIIITGYREFEFVQKAIEYEVAGYVMKPIQDEELRSCLERAIRALETVRSLRAMNSEIEAMRRCEELRLSADSLYSPEPWRSERLRAHFDSLRPGGEPAHAWLIAAMRMERGLPPRRAAPLAALVELEDECASSSPGCGAMALTSDSAVAVLAYGPRVEPLESLKAIALARLGASMGPILWSASDIFYSRAGLGPAYEESAARLYERAFGGRFSPRAVSGPCLDAEDAQAMRICLSLQDYRGAAALAEKAVESALGGRIAPRGLDACVVDIAGIFAEFSDYFRQLKAEMEAMPFRALRFSSREDIVAAFEEGVRLADESEYSRAKSIVGYIHRNYSSPLTLNVLGEKFHLTPLYLGQLLKNETGTSFRNYLNALRIAEAKKVLSARGDTTIADLAGRLGFSDEKYFSQVFKKMVGCAPSAYREGDPSVPEA
jgi:Response regulator containing CheY-like receiver domain and AraC-type DNA-binding domain